MPMRPSFGRFCRDQSGAVMPIIAVSLLTLVTLIAVAIDMSRMYMIRTKVNSALDASVLAASNAITGIDPADTARINATMNAVSRKYFEANLPSGYMGVTYDDDQPKVSYSSTTLLTDGTAAVRMPMIFGAFTHVDHFAAGSKNQVHREQTGLAVEVSLALDITPSMCLPENTNGDADLPACNADYATRVEVMNACMSDSRNRYTAMLTAVHGFIDDLDAMSVASAASNGGNPLNVYVGASFYDSFARTSFDDSDKGFSQSVGHGNLAQDEVTYAPYTYQRYMIPQALGLRPVARAWDDFSARLHDTIEKNGTEFGRRSITQCTAETQGEQGPAAVDWTLSPAHKADYDHITSPSDPLYGTSGRPASFNDTKTIKVAIILTDGNNTHYIKTGNDDDPTLAFEHDDGADADFLRRCEGLKKAGVIICPIPLGNPGPKVREIMRSCGSGVNGSVCYHEANDGNQLVSAFNSIADSISDLRITK